MNKSHRRGFLASVASAGAAIGLTSIASAATALGSAAPELDRRETLAPDPWTKRVKGKHRLIIHAHEPTGGLALRWARTFLDTQRASYELKDEDSTVVVGLNGKSIGLVFNDVMWAKYPIGHVLGIPGTVNPVGPATSKDLAGIIARGVIVLVCNNSLRASGARFLPESTRIDEGAQAAFAEEAKANLLPGVEIVPAMVVTLQQAQDLGCRYIYAGG